MPIFWKQEEFGEPIQFYRTHEDNELVLDKHFQFLQNDYRSTIVAVNLLSNVKDSERDLKNVALL